MSKDITAFFKGRIGVAESVYQHDYGRVVILDGIIPPASFDAWFETQGSETAIPVVGADNRVAIPNDCLEHAGKVTLHIPLNEGPNDSEVEYIVTFRVLGRAKPVDGGTPEEQSALSQAIALLQHVPSQIEDYFDEHISPAITQDVGDWLDEHPEATTTVQDGSLTEAKFTSALKKSAIKDYVTPEMYGAVGDGATDDSEAIQAALNSGSPVLFTHTTYSFARTLEITDTCPGLTNLGTLRYTGTSYGIRISDVWNRTFKFGTVIATSTSSFGCICIDSTAGSVAYLNIYFEALKCMNATNGKCIAITQASNYVNEIRFFGGWLHNGRYGVHILNEPQAEQRNHFVFENVGFEGVTSGVYLGNMISNVMFYGCRMEENTSYLIETDPNSSNVNNRVYWYSGRLAPEFLAKCWNCLVWIFGDTNAAGGARINKPLAYCNGCWYGLSYDDGGSQQVFPAGHITYPSTGEVTYDFKGLFKSSNESSRKRYLRCGKIVDADGNPITAINIVLSKEMFAPANGVFGTIGNRFKLWVKVPANASVKFVNGDGTVLWTKTNSTAVAEWYFDLYYTYNWGGMVEFQTYDQVRYLGELTT